MRKLLWLLPFTLISCQPSLRYHGKIRPYALSEFFSDKSSVRPRPEGVIPRDSEDDKTEIEITRDFLERGQERFDIYCQVCHGLDGSGQGMAVLRGFPEPPSFHTDQLRQKPLDYFYEVISDGRGRMFGYSNRIPKQDRWAIAAYVRALQLRQHFPASQLSSEDLKSGQKGSTQ